MNNAPLKVATEAGPWLVYACARVEASDALAVVAITMLISLSVAASPPPNGVRDLELTFQVVDADSGSPIAGALVGVVYPYPDEFVPASYATTEVDGAARLRHTFFVGDRLRLVPGAEPRPRHTISLSDFSLQSLAFALCATDCSIHAPKGMHYEHTQHVCYGDRWLEVSACGYRPLAVALTRYIGETGRLGESIRGPVRVELQRGDPLSEFPRRLGGRVSPGVRLVQFEASNPCRRTI